MVYINVVYDDEKSDYKNISHCAVRFGVRQWQDGKAELYFEFENGSDKLIEVSNIRTINIADIREKVSPVVHAKWVEEYGDIKCSVCSATYSDEIVFMNRDCKAELLKYCPNCGAIMDAEEDTQETHKED